ncbi:MAG: DUF3995 domain-containing protein [Antricoccus sp.]
MTRLTTGPTQADIRPDRPFRRIPDPIADTAIATASAVLALRGILGLATSCLGQRTCSPFRELDVALYSPFCLGRAALLARAAGSIASDFGHMAG